MALFFSGAVTSSPIKRRPRTRHSCHSLDVSLLSPDSSYVCYSSADGGGDPSCCRRSPRLLTNGYYAVTEDSFCWDDDGNVSLTPCKTNVSYKENLVRVFRHRRRPRGSLARLLSDVTESCHSWLDQKVFGGVFGAGQNQDQDRNLNQDQEEEPDGGRDWVRGGRGAFEESDWSGVSSTVLDDGGGGGFTYDPTEVPPPPGKVAPPPKLLIQEEICSEICQSQERFTQSLGGLSEVPPPSLLYPSGCCCQAPPPQRAGLTMKTLLILFLAVFVFAAVCSGSACWGLAAAAAACVAISASMFLTRSGPMGEWRRAKTEDITSRNE